MRASRRAAASASLPTPPAYAQQAMAWATNAGLITGVTDDTLSPQGMASRAQVATILMRFVTGLAD